MLKLEKEQDDLISTLVEAARSRPRGQRPSFFASWPGSGHTSGYDEWIIKHPGIPGGSIKAPLGDITVLKDQGFFAVSDSGRDTLRFDISPHGFDYYEEMKAHSGQPAQRVEAVVRSYLDAEGFQRRYPGAYMKWTDAESKLWRSDSADQLTTIGHLCREALQEFTTVLVDLYKPQDVDPTKSLVKSRIRSVINAHSKRLGDRERRFLDALISYWDSINDLTQRQEHGAQKEGIPLLWEDARRLVFQTAIVMFEIDKALSRF